MYVSLLLQSSTMTMWGPCMFVQTWSFIFVWNIDLHFVQDQVATHWGFWPSGRGKVSLPLSPGFEPQRIRLSPPRCLTCLLGLQGVQWVRRLVVVRVSWPGHPGLPKKKKIKLLHVAYVFLMFRLLANLLIPLLYRCLTFTFLLIELIWVFESM